MPQSSAKGRLPRVFSSILIVFLLAGVVQPCLAKAGHTRRKDAKRQIEDLETQWRDAELTQNVSLLDKLLSEDYFGISLTGQVTTKAQQLDRMRKRTLMLSRIDLSDVKVKLVGTTAIVTSRAAIVGVSDGLPMQGSFRYTRVYQRSPGGQWKIINFEATRLPRSPGPEEQGSPLP